MNNIRFHNLVRRIDKQIADDMAETIDIVKNGYRCIGNCYLRRRNLCKARKECDWDLKSNFYTNSYD